MMAGALGERLGIALPIVQAPMAGVQDSALAIAVSAAGGLGSLPCAMLTPERIRDEVEAIRGATDKPFNLNFFCHSPPPPDPAREAAWLETLMPYYEELGLGGSQGPGGPGRQPFSEQGCELVEALQPPVVSFHFGLPTQVLLQRVKASGALVLSTATTVREARWLEARGVDGIIAQGIEAGGHRGMFLSDDIDTQSGTFALLPQVCEAVSVPVIAAGGIATAAGVRAALELGADMVQAGTVYLLCPEASTSELHRRALATAGPDSTVLTNRFSGRPARGIVNRLLRELGPYDKGMPPFPHAAAALAPLRQAAEQLGRDDFSPLWSGQNASACRTESAADITRELAAI